MFLMSMERSATTRSAVVLVSVDAQAKVDGWCSSSGQGECARQALAAGGGRAGGVQLTDFDGGAVVGDQPDLLFGL